jgi:hypothetical protein
VHVFVSSAAGIALSSLGLAVAANPDAWSYVRLFASVPQWPIAGVIAALIHRAAPLAWKLITSRLTSAGGTNA